MSLHTDSREIVVVDRRIGVFSINGFCANPAGLILGIEVNGNAGWLSDAGSLAGRHSVRISWALLDKSRRIYSRLQAPTVCASWPCMCILRVSTLRDRPRAMVSIVQFFWFQGEWGPRCRISTPKRTLNPWLLLIIIKICMLRGALSKSFKLYCQTVF